MSNYLILVCQKTFIRLIFISQYTARVYAILAVQLVITASSCLLFGLHPFLSKLPLHIASGQYQGVLATIPLLGILVSTIAWFRVCMSPQARQKSPNKWVWLTLFTLGESVSVGFLTSFFEFQSVVISMGATAIATITVSAFTILQKNPKYDLSQWGNMLGSWAMILLVYLLIGWVQQIGFLPAGFLPFSSMMYSFLASCLFSAFLAHHTKLIVAGKHAKYRMHEKDYVLGAMALYHDIINIFLNILQILGREKE
jgi:FtsH-binding integral membrane protein